MNQEQVLARQRVCQYHELRILSHQNHVGEKKPFVPKLDSLWYTFIAALTDWHPRYILSEPLQRKKKSCSFNSHQVILNWGNFILFQSKKPQRLTFLLYSSLSFSFYCHLAFDFLFWTITFSEDWGDYFHLKKQLWALKMKSRERHSQMWPVWVFSKHLKHRF